MALKQQINDDMKAAMRARDGTRLSAIRLLLAAIKQREIDERKELSDSEVVAVVEKMIKQRRESIVQFEKGGREDLAAGERFELTVLQAYMPSALSEAQIAAAVDAAMDATNAKTMADMGKVMTILKSQLAGRSDMAQVSALVKAKLAG